MRADVPASHFSVVFGFWFRRFGLWLGFTFASGFRFSAIVFLGVVGLPGGGAVVCGVETFAFKHNPNGLVHLAQSSIAAFRANF